MRTDGPDNNGWVRLYRKLIESAVWQDDGLLKLWVYCLLAANHEPGWVPGRGRTPVRIERGQFMTGRFALHGAMYPKKTKHIPNPRTVWRWLKILENMENLSTRMSNQFTIVTVLNYDTYQQRDFQNVPQNVPRVSNGCPTGVQRVSTNKKNKKKEEEEEEFSAALGSPPVENGESKAIVSPSVDLAVTWYELLKLEHTKQSEEKDQADFEDLLSVTYDIDAGKLPPSARETLTTLAHQIGNRDPMPNSPLGMFLAEVGKMRLRASRAPKGPG